MSDEPENLMLVYLRRLDAKMDRLTENITDMRQRLTALEIQAGNNAATENSHYANTALHLDRLDRRLDRIERRLDIVPAG